MNTPEPPDADDLHARLLARNLFTITMLGAFAFCVASWLVVVGA